MKKEKSSEPVAVKAEKKASPVKPEKEPSPPKKGKKATPPKKATADQSATKAVKKGSPTKQEQKEGDSEIKTEGATGKPKPINPFERTVKVQDAGQGLSGADYDPSKKKYDPIKDAFWKRDEK